MKNFFSFRDQRVRMGEKFGKYGIFGAIALAVVIGVVACTDATQFKRQLKAEVDALQVVLDGGQSPLAAVSPSVLPLESEADLHIDAEQENRTRMHAEILQEMVRVVLEQDPQILRSFGDWVNSLNQGASIEGVYRGLVLSDRYRALEEAAPAATAPALKFFESEWPPGGESLVGKSVYTLKRLLGDRMLNQVDERASKPEQLADWYAETVLRLNTHGVDYGLRLRNGGTKEFHFSWAMRANPELLRWELLNRVHRVLNHLQTIR